MADGNGWRSYVITSLPGVVLAAVLFGVLQERVDNNTNRIAAGILPDADRRMAVVEDDQAEFVEAIRLLRDEFRAFRDGRSGDRYTGSQARQDRQRLMEKIDELEQRLDQQLKEHEHDQQL